MEQIAFTDESLLKLQWDSEMQNEVSQQDKNEFLSQSALFIEEFEHQFVEYFCALCSSYHCLLPQDEKKEVAEIIYRNIFNCNYDAPKFKDNIFLKMRQDGVMVGFLINRSMFYLLEGYINFAKSREFSSQVETLIRCITRFIQVFENEITTKVEPFIGDFDFSLEDSPFVTNNIIEMFHKIKEDDESIRFLNLYQGVPISYEAKVLEIEGDAVTFSIDRLQEIAMKLDGNAYIVKNAYLIKHLKADILYNDYINNTVTLHNFIYMLNMPAIQREYIRVHPDIIAKVYLRQFGNIQTSGRLYDLSMKGLGVVSNENNGVFIGAKVMVDFALNADTAHKGKTIEVEAEVVNILEYKGSYRYCMRIFPEKEMMQSITEYILEREKEIIQNLKDELKEYIV